MKICLIGLGYVGLPLAVEFAKKYDVVGFDISLRRINELNLGIDTTLEISRQTLTDLFNSNSGHSFLITNELEDIKDSNVYIVTVPTPVDKYNRPILKPLIDASENVGKFLKKNDIVIFESTVYPGVTEEECVPILEKKSGLFFNKDFYVGYSPERINPGDKIHTVSNIMKITSGSTPETATFVDKLYKSIIKAGTFKASSIKVAEAAKVIENSQRDINIAFVNELSKIFNLMSIDTKEVLEAAGTKWNFHKYSPGLVGGHCIGVDPYYLAQKAQELGFHPEIILAGRRINDGMGKYVAQETVKHMIRKNIKVLNSKILILGFTFKENCPDFRNTKVIDIYNELVSYSSVVDIYDPWVDTDKVKKIFSVNMIKDLNNLDLYSAIILAVSHDEFKDIDIIKSDNRVIYDVKSLFDQNIIDARL
jgi:UDP-N-acetyl-D-galactosamine dehydrogenase